MNKPHNTPAALLAAALLLLAPAFARAQTYIETTDAGATLATAYTITGGGSLTTISGTLSDAYDVDLFKIVIASPTLFSATTIGSSTPWDLDTQLYLFDSTGHAVFGNDDADYTTLQSTISASSISHLTSGIYYLAISQSGNDPVNSVSQLLFTGYGADSTAALTASTLANPTTLSDWTNGTYFADSGSYQIALTGVTAVPEVATTASALGACALAAGMWLRRRRTAIAA